ncbi:hypothetical protein M446_1870 [Methylobacterium sp. 4-46]|uniref:hypothetical protein n=1 Tax=unclassified Methylobacterium TaxID=2615210 RepID=UPI000165C9BE|nr:MULTISPECIES: hypothetical protein [Methylobacterium]ACA16352.1 hypothetical protein M446_1870 [Methylobacterium sp. 4-46]WFT82058.1 hypothetical protein QA634_09470 [Methylobacterium nodulans]
MPRELAGQYAAARLSDAEYERLDREIRANVPVQSRRFWAKRVRPNLGRRAASHHRRIACSGPLPPTLAARYTPHKLAVLGVMGDALRSEMSVAEIAARAGVCIRTAQSALGLAERGGLLTITERPRKGAKSMTNVIDVTSREWQQWLSHSRRRRGIGCKPLHPSGMQSSPNTPERVGDVVRLSVKRAAAPSVRVPAMVLPAPEEPKEGSKAALARFQRAFVRNSDDV